MRRILFEAAMAAMVAAMPLLVPHPASGASFEYRLDVSAGGFLPFDEDVREVFDGSPMYQLAFSPRLPRGDAWVFAEISYVADSGQEYSPDPTFERPDSEFRLIPVALGIRGNLIRDSRRGDVELHVGVGWQWAFARYTDSEGHEDNAVAPGFFIEFRPQLPVAEHWEIWVRQRVSIMFDSQFDTIPDLNFSSSNFELGLSYRS